MPRQSEQILEEQLIANLKVLGYDYIAINNENDLLVNLKGQLEKHNKITFSQSEFEKVLNIINKGSVFEKAKTLREKQHIVRDNGDNLYFEFLSTEHWCQNEYQVTNQVSQEGKYKNRYDVTLLINGFPLVHIELKRKGLELKEAFNQINRYQRHSFAANSALFQYVQIFVISNGVNTKYYANNRFQSFKQTFYWTDNENKRITNILNGFTDDFLEPCHISKMICKYIVLNETQKILMVLRPYQYYAVEALVDKVMHSKSNGYIWHTTGSGKTLTSFKASQILTHLPKVKKVVFVVDRKDLDYQTNREFEGFQPGSVDATSNTDNLVKQFLGTYKDKKGEPKDTKLIVTTIQKLNAAISKKQFLAKMGNLKDERIVFIFDECHRSQFGETHSLSLIHISEPTRPY
jgi:type I restriction enzyme R subunit